MMDSRAGALGRLTTTTRRSEDAATAILRAHPWRDIFEALERASTTDGGEEDAAAARALARKLGETRAGVDALARAFDENDATFAMRFERGFEDAETVETACALVRGVYERATMEEGARAAAAATRAATTRRCGEKDTGTAIAASGALLALCARFPEMLEDVLGDVLEETSREGGTSEAKVRGLAFAASAAAANEDAASVVVKSGALDACVREIDGPDLLSSLASLEILAEVAESSSAAARGLKSVGSLGDALVRATLDETADPALRTRAMIVGARIAATCATSDEALVQEMARVLTAQESNFRDAVVDAAGELCLTNAIVATNFVKTTKTVVFTAADSALRGRGESQVVALHALANVFGAERGEQEILDDEAESILADAIFAACGSKSFGDIISTALANKSDHFVNLRVAVYRLLSTAGHRARFAEEIAAHPSARDALALDVEPALVAARASPRARRPRRRRHRRRSRARPLSRRRHRVAARLDLASERRPGRPRVPSPVASPRQTSNVKRQMSTPRESRDSRDAPSSARDARLSRCARAAGTSSPSSTTIIRACDDANATTRANRRRKRRRRRR